MKTLTITLTPRRLRRASALLTRLQSHALPAACLCALLMVLCAVADLWAGAGLSGAAVIGALSPLSVWANWCDEKAVGY